MNASVQTTQPTEPVSVGMAVAEFRFSEPRKGLLERFQAANRKRRDASKPPNFSWTMYVSARLFGKPPHVAENEARRFADDFFLTKFCAPCVIVAVAPLVLPYRAAVLAITQTTRLGRKFWYGEE